MDETHSPPPPERAATTRFPAWARTVLIPLGILLGMILAMANWYLVDPFKIRALPTPARYLLTAATGAPLGALFGFSLRGLITRRTRLRWGVLPAFLGLWLLVSLALPLKAAPNRFSAAPLEITVSDQAAPVWLERILVASEPYLFEKCNEAGAWEPVDGLLTLAAGESAALTCALVQPAGTSVEVVFASTSGAAFAQVRLGSSAQAVALKAAPGSLVTRTVFSFPRKSGTKIVVLMRVLDAFFLLLGITAALRAQPIIGRRLNAVNIGYSAWFAETTPRIRAFAFSAAAVSAAITAILFIQPLLSTSPPPKIRSDSTQIPPNIIFILVDALSADDLSLLGYPLPTTPNLENATQDWTVYSNAQSPLTCTVAALPTFLTGRYPYVNDFASYGDQVRKQNGWLSAAERLRDAGYQTWWSGYLSPGFYHLGDGFERSICRPDDRLQTALNRSWFQVRAISKNAFPFLPYTLDQLDLVEEGREDFNRCEELDSLAQVLRSRQVRQPFFMYYHYRGVHGIPYPGGDSLGTFLPLAEGMFSQNGQHGAYGPYDLSNQAAVDRLRRRYAEAIADQDRKFADFIEQLKAEGLFDSALIIVTADHGQSFHHGISSHCTSLISSAEAHVPLLIKFPGQSVGRRVDSLVSTVDVAPTILSAAGIEVDPGWFDGTALQPDAEPPQSGRIVFTRRSLVSSKNLEDIAVSDGQLRLVNRRDGLYLFDIRVDPLETANLLEQPEYASRPAVLRLRQALDSYIQRGKDVQDGINILSAPDLSP